MNKLTKYYFLIRMTIISFVLHILLGIANNVLDKFRYVFPDLFDVLMDLISGAKVILVILIIVGILALVVFIYKYSVSKFYSNYQIGVIEAIYHGFADIHGLYDRLIQSGKVIDLQVDLKRSTIYFMLKDQYYSILYIDLLGKIQGKLDSEFWAKVSKPKKEYNQKKYTKLEKFDNPYRLNKQFCQELKSKTGKEYQNFVVIDGFYQMELKSDKILSPYQIIDFLK